MKRFLLKVINCAFLVLVVVGIPSITRVQFRSLQLASGPKLQLLLFWTLAIALAFNLLAGAFLIKVKKDRVHCWEWAAVFGVLLFAYCAFVLGYFNFDWLKNLLLKL